MGWSDQQVKSFAKLLRRHVGDGWRYMTEEVRTAIVEARVLGIVCGQVSDTIVRSDVEHLRQRMLEEFGLMERKDQSPASKPWTVQSDVPFSKRVLEVRDGLMPPLLRSVSASEFIDSNKEDSDVIDQILILGLNEEISLGGGAQPRMTVKRVR